MTSSVRTAAVIFAGAVLLVTACGRPRDTLRPEALADAGTRCLGGRGAPCPAGQTCADLTGLLADAGADAVCVWGDSACDAVTCESDTCLNLEKYPPIPSCQ